MELALNDLIESKIFVRNNLSFMPAKDLINNFLDSIKYSNEQVTIKAQNAVVNQNVEGGDNIAYPRFLVEVDAGRSPIVDEINVMGMIVAMDQQKPQVKIYSGMNARACMNLSIFNASHVLAQDLLSNLNNVWAKSKIFYQEEDAKFQEHIKVNKLLKETTLTNKEVDNVLGNMLRRGSQNSLGTSPVVGAASLLGDRKSIYYFDPMKGTTLENVYGSVTQGITDSKDLLSKPNKTLVVAELLSLLN